MLIGIFNLLSVPQLGPPALALLLASLMSLASWPTVWPCLEWLKPLLADLEGGCGRL